MTRSQQSNTVEHVDSRPASSIFQQPWYLDGVAGPSWGEVRCEEHGTIVGYLPYVVKKRFGLTVLTSPHLTPMLGPWILEGTGKYPTRIGRENELLKKLIRSLPHAYSYVIPCHPAIANMLAFHWAGFQLRVRYTYGFPDLRDVGAIWAGMEQSTRTAIRKAERSLTIIEDLGIDEFLKINRMTFVRQGKQPPYTDDLVRRLDATLAARNCRKMFFAVDSARQIHSALYVVWDDRCAYTLMIGSDPRFRSSNADTMLFYHALRCAAGVSASFNFCGSMVEGIELHLRSFGARQIPAYTASKHSYPVRIALSLLARS